MMQRKLLASALLGFALLAMPSVSHAQGASEKAAAEALFDEGVSLLKQGNYQEASQRLESSQRIDPGIGTLLYLGEAYEKLGRTASAWATFREAASQAKAAGQTDRAKLGADRADRLTPKLNKVTLQLAPENQGITGLEIVDSSTGSVAQAKVGASTLSIHALSSTKPEVRDVKPGTDCWSGDRGKCDATRFPIGEYRVQVPGPTPQAIHVIDVGGGDAVTVATLSPQTTHLKRGAFDAYVSSAKTSSGSVLREAMRLSSAASWAASNGR